MIKRLNLRNVFGHLSDYIKKECMNWNINSYEEQSKWIKNNKQNATEKFAESNKRLARLAM